jgi:hypothetical protein
VAQIAREIAFFADFKTQQHQEKRERFLLYVAFKLTEKKRQQELLPVHLK